MDLTKTDKVPIDLQKKVEKVTIQLAKKGIQQAPIMRVGVALDISGSMYQIISSGRLQTAFNQIMGVAVTFDDNGELDVFKFDDRCEYVGTSKPEAGDYDQFIRNNRITDRGGTAFAPIVEAARNFFFKPKGGAVAAAAGKVGGFFGFGKSKPAEAPATTVEYEDNTPVLMLILTDGEPGDRNATMRAMKATEDAGLPIYYHMVGINGTRDSFRTIAWLADELGNVGEVYLPSIDMTDDEIYAQVIGDELVGFVANFAQPVLSRNRG